MECSLRHPVLRKGGAFNYRKDTSGLSASESITDADRVRVKTDLAGGPTRARFTRYIHPAPGGVIILIRVHSK